MYDACHVRDAELYGFQVVSGGVAMNSTLKLLVFYRVLLALPFSCCGLQAWLCRPTTGCASAYN